VTKARQRKSVFIILVYLDEIYIRCSLYIAGVSVFTVMVLRDTVLHNFKTNLFDIFSSPPPFFSLILNTTSHANVFMRVL